MPSAATSGSAPSPTTTTASAPTSSAGERPPSSGEKRETEWHDLERLLRHADGLPVAAEVSPAVAAIRDGRQLLDDPDPIAPLLDELAAALRDEVVRRAEQLADAQRAAVAELEAWDEWDKLDARGPRRHRRRSQAGRRPVRPTSAPTAKLLEALDATPLSAWNDRISLVPSRRDQARQRAAKQLEPESVAVDASVGDDQDRRGPRQLRRRAPRAACSRTSTPARP